MILTFEKITVRNFLGFGDIPVEFELNATGTSLINGKNGAGKTTILNAIVVAAYDKPLSGGADKKDSLINNINKKCMELILEFTKGKNKYKIHRCRKMVSGAKGTYVTIFENGKDISPDSIGNGNALIESIIGIPYDLFIRIATISATYTPFLSLPVKHASQANQTDIIEELFDLKSLSDKAAILKDQMKEVKQSLTIQHAKREALENERARHEKQLKLAQARKDNWGDEIVEEIAELAELLKKAQSVDVENEKAAFEAIAELEEEMGEYTLANKEIRTLLRTHQSAQRDTETELVDLEKGNCPYCKQTMAGTKAKVAAAKKILKKCEKDIADCDKQSTEIKEAIMEINDRLNELTSKTTQLNVNELFKIESKIEKYEDKIADLEQQENPHTATLDELLNVIAEEVETEEIDELEDLLKHQDMVLKLLTKKDSFVRKNLINKSIPYLNKRLNHYLKELQLPQLIEFKHDMTATVSKFGRELDFSNLSAGQKARVNLAMSFAFRDVLQNLHGQINICLLDEVLDVALDAEGAGVAADMLIRKGQEEGVAIYVISHKEELQTVFERTISVSLVDEFTTLAYIDNE